MDTSDALGPARPGTPQAPEAPPAPGPSDTGHAGGYTHFGGAWRKPSVIFWVSTLLKRCLEEAAAHMRQSQTNMLENPGLDHCHPRSIARLAEEPTPRDDHREGMHVHRGIKR